MKKLRKRFELFCMRNRNKGIANLMLYLTVGSAIVYFFTLVTENTLLYETLCFNYYAILQGQVWRLITFPLTYMPSDPFSMLISLYCYYSIGRAVEASWGTLRFNLYYLTGMILLDIYGMVFGSIVTAGFLNLSMILAYATLYPETRFLMYFVLPIKAWVMALFYLIIMVYELLKYPYPLNLASTVALLNYFLFFGKDVVNLLPESWRSKFRRRSKPAQPRPTSRPNVVQFQIKTEKIRSDKIKVDTNYNHRCTVCGRTDVSHPDLEFRYCSRCKGYHCYCEDHIGNHTHVE